MTNYNWNYPTTIWVGKNRINDLNLACNNLKIKNPLFVTDKDSDSNWESKVLVVEKLGSGTFLYLEKDRELLVA